MEKYNLDKLIKVVINDKYHARWFSYKKEKRFLWFRTRKEGFYEWVWDEFVGVDVPKNHFMKDGVLYEKPEVVLCYQNDYTKTYYFDTYLEAQTFASNLTNDKKYIQ